MNRFASNHFTRWAWRGLAGLTLLLGLVIGTAAYADTYNKITLYAPDAPAGAWTVVQYQTPDGAWHVVEGWQGSLDTFDDTGLRFKAWAVSSENADQGPFRWVVYTAEGGDVWGISNSFNLPGGDGVNLESTVQATNTATDTADGAGATTSPVQAQATDVTGALPVVSDSSTWYFDCSDCDHSLITVFLPDAPIGSAVGVQYQGTDGLWYWVQTWRTTLATNSGGTAFVQWSVGQDNFNQGPFRWVVSRDDGTVWGVSSQFNLPAAGINYILFLHRQ